MDAVTSRRARQDSPPGPLALRSSPMSRRPSRGMIDISRLQRGGRAIAPAVRPPRRRLGATAWRSARRSRCSRRSSRRLSPTAARCWCPSATSRRSSCRSCKRDAASACARCRLHALAEAVGPQTSLVAFSLVQSATGEIADAAAIVAAAGRHGARTFCDATQAVGWLPVEASRFDALVCHAYKWLCAPRGVAFLAIGEDLQSSIIPRFAGWYAGADPWASCYGGEFGLASDARASTCRPRGRPSSAPSRRSSSSPHSTPTRSSRTRRDSRLGFVSG